MTHLIEHVRGGVKRMSRSNTMQRFDYVTNACRGKRVLHLGCADHPITERKLAMGALLHSALDRVAGTLYGMDVNSEAIGVLRRTGYQNLFVGDAEHLTEIIPAQDIHFDVIVAGELLEHLSNPGRFLDAVKAIMDPDSQLIITTVNAFCLFRFIYYVVHLGVERIHADHVAYYSASTLTALAQRHGFEIQDVRYYPIGRELRRADWVPRYFWLLDRLSYWPCPFLAAGLIIALRVK
jgi:2-polyprenyl-3-methyl-5-hydroxy-6-metoxy-1,4-benzoquinol methylase